MDLDVIFDETIFLMEKVRERYLEQIKNIAKLLYETFKTGGKLLICGNGGSAADAQHIAAEFINRFRIERQPLPAIALTTDTSVLTSIGNDYDYIEVFSKQVKALANKGDMLFAISTSGTSKNVLLALKEAKDKGVITVGFSGDYREEMGRLCNHYIALPSRNTPRIQEVLLVVEHAICELIDEYWRRDNVPHPE